MKSITCPARVRAPKDKSNAEGTVGNISVDGMLYSVPYEYTVPYEYIKKKVDVKVIDTTIEIFYNHNCRASHRRLKGRSGQYSTITEHMPEDHQKYLEWNGDCFRKWAERIGINTYIAIKQPNSVSFFRTY